MKTQNDAFRPYADAETFAKIVEMDSVSEMWAHCLKEYAEKEAIWDDGQKYTYAAIEEDCKALRAVLLQKGLQKGDNVGIYAPNSYEFVKAYLSAVTLGLCAVILPPHLDDQTVFGCTMKFQLKAVIYHPAFEEKTVFAKTHGSKALFISSMEKTEEKAELVTGLTRKDPAVVMFTGGTTGKSKGALLSNGALMQGAVNGCYGYQEVFGQRYLLVLPLSHVFGLIRNLMTSLYTGSVLFICRNNKDMFRDIAMFRPTIMVMVPALLEMCLTLSKQFKKNMLGEDLKTIIAGAAIVPPYLIKEYKKLGITVLPGYGLTESANLVSGNPKSEEKPSSVGVLYPNMEVKVVNDELLLRGENMLVDYVGEPEKAYDEEGWFHTGDLVRFDEEGYLYITGRIKEVIVLPTGENISPAELETKFNELTCVADTQVYESENEQGQIILALEAVPRMTELGGVENVAEYVTNELARVNQELPSHMRVQKIIIRTEDFKRTPSMKIERYKKIK